MNLMQFDQNPDSLSGPNFQRVYIKKYMVEKKKQGKCKKSKNSERELPYQTARDLYNQCKIKSGWYCIEQTNRSAYRFRI